jgi:O-methyltransferase involved in polyketide biosynthesis
VETEKHSITALVAALVRAYHHNEGAGAIFDDPHAHQLLQGEEREFIESKWLESMGDRGRQLVAQHSNRTDAVRAALRELPFPAVMLARARFTEDLLFD